MTATARSTPVGSMLTDGFATKIAFSQDTDISFWEKTVKPVGLDGGEPIDITTMWNTSLRTFAPRQLKTGTQVTANVAYDPQVYDQIQAIINVNGWITVHLPDGSGVNFVGFLKSFEPAENQEGNQPMAAITVVCTNWYNDAETEIEYSSTGTGT